MQKHKILLLSLFAIVSLFFAFFDFSQANELSYQLRGRILLQVEEHGRLWYVNPENLQAFELKKGDYQSLLADIAIGISSENLQKIAMDYEMIDPALDSDGDSYLDYIEVQNSYDPYGPGRWQGDYILSQNMAGRFLLDVEDHGRLWYVHPESLKRYEIRQDNWQDFFERTSLGIDNKNFSNILRVEERLSWKSKEDDPLLFMQNFRNCEAMNYEMKLNDDYILEYDILGEESGRCRLASRFLVNPNETWENKEMNCLYDYKAESITEALVNVFIDEEADCEGALFDLFKGN